MYDPREFCCKKCLVPVDTRYVECGPGGPIDYGVCPECGYTSSVWNNFILADPIELEHQQWEQKMYEEEAARDKAEHEAYLANGCSMKCMDPEDGCMWELNCKRYDDTYRAA
jgi:hypothetical protein